MKVSLYWKRFISSTTFTLHLCRYQEWRFGYESKYAFANYMGFISAVVHFLGDAIEEFRSCWKQGFDARKWLTRCGYRMEDAGWETFGDEFRNWKMCLQYSSAEQRQPDPHCQIQEWERIWLRAMRVQLSCVEGWRVQKVSGTLSWQMVWFSPLTPKLWGIEMREILKSELIFVIVVVLVVVGVVGRCHWSWHGHSQSINAKVWYFLFFWKCPSIFES